jgi:hypothetical protein
VICKSVVMRICLCRGAAVVGCLGGIVGYAQVPAVLEVVSSNLACGELAHTANTNAITRITIMHKYLLKFWPASFMETV